MGDRPPLTVAEMFSTTVTVFEAVLTHPPLVTTYVMTEVPAAIACTRPDEFPTVAMDGAPLVHVPPDVVLVQVCDSPIQMGVEPEMVCAVGAVMVTVLVAVLMQAPMVTEYMMTDVPEDRPVITPVDVPAVATAGLPLVHVPPDDVPVHVCDEPTQMGEIPVIV